MEKHRGPFCLLPTPVSSLQLPTDHPTAIRAGSGPQSVHSMKPRPLHSVPSAGNSLLSKDKDTGYCGAMTERDWLPFSWRSAPTTNRWSEY